MSCQPIECSGCEKGISACSNRAGWPTPQEAKAMLDAGLAKRLMLDFWSGDHQLEDTQIICPAEDDRGGGTAASIFPGGVCTFFVNQKCEIHNSGFKPLECRVMCCKKKNTNLHLNVAKTWNSDEGRAVVEEWKRLVNY